MNREFFEGLNPVIKNEDKINTMKNLLIELPEAEKARIQMKAHDEVADVAERVGSLPVDQQIQAYKSELYRAKTIAAGNQFFESQKLNNEINDLKDVIHRKQAIADNAR